MDRSRANVAAFLTRDTMGTSSHHVVVLIIQAFPGAIRQQNTRRSNIGGVPADKHQHLGTCHVPPPTRKQTASWEGKQHEQLGPSQTPWAPIPAGWWLTYGAAAPPSLPRRSSGDVRGNGSPGTPQVPAPFLELTPPHQNPFMLPWRDQPKERPA
ncbi:hypothetical protein DPEC_G00182850 [Dallia pectoralis]|uniref:Uncharacterized protein n=1 Tax=Dallia pectoralis TaxID=75939 RepID=A0ACC2GAN1_DALPE|nr:hypothetical protein DPEC_G00182850 [Dallia pectoralis]